jgi:Flp pilus assembly protein TadB
MFAVMSVLFIGVVAVILVLDAVIGFNVLARRRRRMRAAEKAAQGIDLTGAAKTTSRRGRAGVKRIPHARGEQAGTSSGPGGVRQV